MRFISLDWSDKLYILRYQTNYATAQYKKGLKMNALKDVV